MSRAPELDQLLDTVRAVVDQHVVLGRAEDFPALLDALDGCGVLTLAEDTADLEDSLVWLWEVVAEVAVGSASVAFSLASRYAADRAAQETPGEHVGVRSAAPATVAGDSWAVAAPLALEPGWVLAVLADGRGAWFETTDATTVSRPARTGLAQADLAVLRFASPTVVGIGAGDAFEEWSVLVSAAAVGVGQGSLRAAERYALERSQFGAAIATFAGLRALLASMHERVVAARALGLLAAAPAGSDRQGSAALDLATRSALDVSLDAVQVHGGYGYMDEYPVASRVRDAVSLRARARPREALARMAEDRMPRS